MDLEFKIRLHRHCLDLLDQRIADAQRSMEGFQEAANSETKSTAGDKHETSRAMMQADREKVARQLANLLQMRPLLAKVEPVHRMTHGAVGALVQTDKSLIYIAVPLGAVELDKKRIMVVSAVSPVGQELVGKKVGESFEVNGRKQSVLGLF